MIFCVGLVLCGALALSGASAEGLREQRSLFQWHKSIQCIINMGALEPNFKNYGCHCRLDAGGKTVDKLDKCCKKRAQCIKKVLKTSDRKLFHRCSSKDPEVEVYSVIWTCHAGTMKCGDSQGTCNRGKCECDKAAMLCLKKRVKKHKQKFENYDKKLC